jgi:hypothetical protein
MEDELDVIHWLEIRGGFQKSWASGLKSEAHPNLGENAISWE